MKGEGRAQVEVDGRYLCRILRGTITIRTILHTLFAGTKSSYL